MQANDDWVHEQSPRIDELIHEYRLVLHDSFDQAVTGRSLAEIGVAGTVDGSFTLRRTDTVASVQATFHQRWDASHNNLAGLDDHDVALQVHQ
jgi:hypothetical protein